MTSSSDSLVLIGPMGAGKTSIGRRVAKALGTTFTDTDAALAREHGAIPQIFTDHGEAHFRRLEREAVRTSLGSGGVVSLGGGAILDPSTRADLAAHRVVFLTVEPRVVASRLRDDSRPLLAGDDAMTRWLAIYAERRPLYEEVADVTFDTSTGPLQAAVEAIAAWARTTIPTEEQHA
ncbi:shikimate kinase [Microbacterium sp. P06]|uniref:shikimate kinase n=1 Tax=unclassified Microbacterium TaxID=2609290 RepID=UPI003745E288